MVREVEWNAGAKGAKSRLGGGEQCAEEGGQKSGMGGCERGACADETRSGTCGPHRSEPIRKLHTSTLFNLFTWMPQPTLSATNPPLSTCHRILRGRPRRATYLISRSFSRIRHARQNSALVKFLKFADYNRRCHATVQLLSRESRHDSTWSQIIGRQEGLLRRWHLEGRQPLAAYIFVCTTVHICLSMKLEAQSQKKLSRPLTS